MKTRLLKNIKVKGNKIRFEHENLNGIYSFASEAIETIYFDDEALYFYPSRAEYAVQVCDATEKDFEILKKLISKSENFVSCGEEYIFSLENVRAFEEDENFLCVTCSNDYYEVFKSNDEAVKDFFLAMQNRLGEDIETSVSN